MEDEKNESPYCEDCRACGESGCCSPLQCFSKLVEKDTCKYGKGYLLDIKLALEFSEWVITFVDENDALTVKQANKKYREMLNEIFGRDKDV